MENESETLPTREEELEQKITDLNNELRAVYEDKYEQDRAERTAAGFLSAQMDLAYFISSAELHSKQMKSELEFVSADAYFQLKSKATGKVTEASLQQELHKHPDVVKARENLNKAESEIKKWNLLFSSLKEGHIFFRGIGKGKNEW